MINSEGEVYLKSVVFNLINSSLFRSMRDGSTSALRVTRCSSTRTNICGAVRTCVTRDDGTMMVTSNN